MLTLQPAVAIVLDALSASTYTYATISSSQAECFVCNFSRIDGQMIYIFSVMLVKDGSEHLAHVTHPQFSMLSPSMTKPSRGVDEFTSAVPSTYTHLFT